MYTSETTGNPKGAGFSKRNLLSCVQVVWHTPAIYAGGSLLLQSFDNASEIIELIQPERIDYNCMFALAEDFPGDPAARFPKGS